MISVVLVDDHALFRGGIRKWLEASGQVRVVGEADDGRAAIALIERQAPDLVVTDLTMPNLSGLELIGHLAKTHHQLPVLVLSVHEGAAYANRVRDAGGRGYVCKSMADECLLAAILELHRGGSFFCDEMDGDPAVTRATGL